MATTQPDVKSIIDTQKMTFLQYSTIFICFLMNTLDGMDVLVIAYTASAITREWSITPESLGVVFSAAVFGMTLGTLFLAPIADHIGRKKMIIVSAVIMGTSIFATAYSTSVTLLMVLRFISGLGIGGMLASASTLASEYAPSKSKDFWVSLAMSGYPIGAVLAGLVAAYIIPAYGWRTMFQFAGVATLITIPFTLVYLAPSLEFLVKKRPKNALIKINNILTKMQLQTLSQIPDYEAATNSSSVKNLFVATRRKQTLLLWLSFFMAFASLYFLLSWIPKLTTAAGLSERLGIYSGTVFNLGSFVGILVLGGLSIRLGLRKTILIFLVAAAILMMIFGFFSGSVMVLIMFGVIGFTMHGGFVGLYPLAARLYPVEVRTTGIGWAIGAGRFGAIVGPVIAGYLVGAGFSLITNFIIFAVPCIIAGVAAMAIRNKDVS